MWDSSARLAMPYMQQGQAQKHVTHNEALELLDILVQLTVEAFDADEPPAAPQDGQVWALGPAPVAAWSGQSPGTLAAWANGGWLFIQPKAGWRAARGAEMRLWTGSAWVGPQAEGLENVSGLGVNAAHDEENRLAVSSPAALFSHAGGDHRLKINKAAAGDTASLLLQSGFSGRAEIGLAGGDDLTVKVSADGASWTTALSIDASTGKPDLRGGATIDGARAFHRKNIVGTVSQSGGVPTGAVIEQGANANGSFVRFADGTQICWKQLSGLGPVNVGLVSLFRSPIFSLGAWPAAFSDSPAVTMTASGPDIAGWQHVWASQAKRHSATMAGEAILMRATTSGESYFTLDAMAIGRWF
jgi:hypothetical protein